uniref:CD4-2 molecule, tandem duplicate 2 n=1 Tax=Cyprinus carpio carpio TaxID=630221 RepID=A0A9J7X2W8_CYPCA
MATCKILFFLFLALYISCGKCDVFYKRVGDEVSMNCGAPSNSDTEWKFDNVLIFNVKGKTGAKLKGPSHIVLKASTNGENLKVSRLETRDSGNYICSYSGSVKQHNIYVVSVFAKPGPVLVQSSDAELHCDITGNSNTQVQWLRPPNGQKHNEKSQVIKLKSVTSKDAGQWTCQVKDALTLSVTLTVVDLQTTAVNVSEGDDTKLPCSLPQSVSQRVVGGKWKADHLSDVSFPTLKNTENKGLHWNGKDLSKVNFTTEQLSTKFDVTLKNVQHRDAGKFVCTVEFEGGASRSVEMTLTVFGKNSGAGEEAEIHAAASYSQRLLPMQKNESKNEVELDQGVRSLPGPRQEHYPCTRTAGPNHTTERSRAQDPEKTPPAGPVLLNVLLA